MKEKLKKNITEALEKWGVSDVSFSVEATNDETHGEYATNVAMVSAKILKTNPKALASELVSELSENLPKEIEKVEVAGPGFINFFLKREYFSDTVSHILKEGEHYGRSVALKGQKVMVEYTDPNPFKEFHIGHLMSNTIGESIARLYEVQGAEVKRACYQGDVGLHVAKAIWGMQSVPERDENPLNSLSPEAQAQYLGHAYQLGSAAYEGGEKDAIEEINRKVYDRSDSEINKLYDWGRKVSLAYFDGQYKKLGTKFDFNFFESEMAKPGLEIVRKFLGRLFQESDGAIVFHAEKHNPKLHTRVYITSQGLPTYEAKELALHVAKARKYPADASIVNTANEQDGVFAVGLEAFRQIDKEHASRVKHVSHGMLRLPTGKMSSRTGGVITADELIFSIVSKLKEKFSESERKADEVTLESVSIGAIKYSILRQSIGSDIIFDLEKSVSLEGDSGPYLQYAAVRAHSILEKAKAEGVRGSLTSTGNVEVRLPHEWQTRSFERLLSHFPEVVERAGAEFAPQYISTYLIEIAASFNNFYAQEKIVDKDDPHSPYKLALTKAFRTVMENGLWILGIKVPERM